MSQITWQTGDFSVRILLYDVGQSSLLRIEVDLQIYSPGDYVVRQKYGYSRPYDFKFIWIILPLWCLFAAATVGVAVEKILRNMISVLTVHLGSAKEKNITSFMSMASFRIFADRSTGQFCRPSSGPEVRSALVSVKSASKFNTNQLQGVKCPVSNVCSDGQPTSQVRNNSPARPIIPEGRLR